MSTPTVYRLPNAGSIRVEPRKVVSQGLKVENPTGFDHRLNAAIDGLESLLLAMATAGVPMDTPQMHEAVTVAVEAISNQFD
jgi:hypothetical protein